MHPSQSLSPFLFFLPTCTHILIVIHIHGFPTSQNLPRCRNLNRKLLLLFIFPFIISIPHSFFFNNRFILFFLFHLNSGHHHWLTIHVFYLIFLFFTPLQLPLT